MKPLGLTLLALTLTLGTAGLTGCETTPGAGPAAAVQTDSLYNRLGGESGIRKIADSWADRVATNKDLAARFSQGDMDQFRDRLFTQMGERTGGPQVYMGKDMRTLHKGMNISEAEWDAFLNALENTLQAQNVPAVAQEELLLIYTPMKRDVVGQ